MPFSTPKISPRPLGEGIGVRVMQIGMNPPILFNNPLSTHPVSITMSITYRDATYRENPSKKFQKANPFPPIPLPDIFLTILKLGSFTSAKGNSIVGRSLLLLPLQAPAIALCGSLKMLPVKKAFWGCFMRRQESLLTERMRNLNLSASTPAFAPHSSAT